MNQQNQLSVPVCLKPCVKYNILADFFTDAGRHLLKLYVVAFFSERVNFAGKKASVMFSRKPIS